MPVVSSGVAAGSPYSPQGLGGPLIRRILPCLLVAIAGAEYHARSPQSNPPQQTFTTGVELVRLDVSVLDKDRRPVRGLTARDFTVLDDGNPQPIVAFSEVDIPDAEPAAAAWMQQVGSDIATNQLDLRRIIVIVMDDGTTSVDDGTVNAAKQIARGVIGRLGPNDLAAVVFTLKGKSQNFTSDRRRLIATTLEPARFQSGRFADYSIDLPLSRLGAGDYLLTVEATAQKNSARRDVRFQVTPQDLLKRHSPNS